jgi:hypothetical protein
LNIYYSCIGLSGLYWTKLLCMSPTVGRLL